MEFDYIVVGAGSAGCVLADRLSRSPGTRVLVIEAGGSDARFWIKVPLGYGFTFSDPKVNWCYTAEPDEGVNGREAYWPRGRVVGGSSSINAMAYVRGLKHDFDDWETAGATGWGWDTVRQTYERVEHHWEGGSARGDGPLRVSDLSAQMHPFSETFLNAARDLGWKTPADMNEDTCEGLSYFRSTVRNGFRHSAADAFLRPALKRGNVQLIKNALVEKLTFSGTRATGVQYCVGGQQHVATCKGEVIVSAGAVNSPQLLQLSGLGPADLLKAHGIDVVQNLGQVGKGMQDHLAITHHFAANRPTLNDRLGTQFGRMMVGLQYLLTRKGPLSVPTNQVGGFIRSDETQIAPNMQVYCNPVTSSTRAKGVPEVDRASGFVLCVQPCRPTSRGEVSIRSNDPGAAPRIQPNSLSTEFDRWDAIRAGRLLQSLARAPAIAQVTQSAKEPDISRMDDAALLENFRETALTNFHPTCTCRIGRDAADSVLDARLKVHGTQGLRVVDASAFPNVTSGNTNAPTIMLAMRAADLILEDQAARSRQA
ncbi:GMC family oxidoreductase [Roseibium polysiphoniae]|uniref:GMC family oxidoreductase N-terminal domain-containing protein n=1 Tax=Roseibium polysiphoniae TaxID=2571221 RepID=A0ABR9CHQ4_9HYPH|nr:GMC family oxidoreductase N-terminal domain-containing protein [Roseibium polysiphoniae]MBD8878736.1 GMC family oxidoreductase N-terminal domain-containing protein [Roseibium polysiphoniae]